MPEPEEYSRAAAELSRATAAFTAAVEALERDSARVLGEMEAGLPGLARRCPEFAELALDMAELVHALLEHHRAARDLAGLSVGEVRRLLVAHVVSGHGPAQGGPA